MSNFLPSLKTWFILSGTTFLLLIMIHLGLPALLLLLRVPSFTLEAGELLWITQWENTADGSSIQFNLLALLLIAILVGLIGAWIQRSRPRP